MRRLLPIAALLLLVTACSSSEAKPLSGLYIALGDSLSAGNGASDRSTTAFVPLVHQALGANVDLLNLGVPGHTSQDLIVGQLDRAVSEIQKRKADSVPSNDVVVVTLEIGGNNLLDLFFDLVLPGTCPNVEAGLKNDRCVSALRSKLNEYEPDLKLILQRLHEADPNLPIFLMTLYNPFSGKGQALDRLIELALEGEPGSPFPEGLHDIIRAQAKESGAHLADVYPHFEGKGNEYMASDLIHPNDKGYRVMADAVIASMRDANLID
jgi:lysophospholipase L1-like esterase